MQPPARNDAAGRLAIEDIAVASSTLMPAQRLHQGELQAAVRASLGKLNVRQRDALVLSRFTGMNHAEIAKTMHMSPEAVKSLLRRARNNLRMLLKPYVDAA